MGCLPPPAAEILTPTLTSPNAKSHLKPCFLSTENTCRPDFWPTLGQRCHLARICFWGEDLGRKGHLYDENSQVLPRSGRNGAELEPAHSLALRFCMQRQCRVNGDLSAAPGPLRLSCKAPICTAASSEHNDILMSGISFPRHSCQFCTRSSLLACNSPLVCTEVSRAAPLLTQPELSSPTQAFSSTKMFSGQPRNRRRTTRGVPLALSQQRLRAAPCPSAASWLHCLTCRGG